MTESPYPPPAPGSPPPWPAAPRDLREAPTALAVATVATAIGFALLAVVTAAAAWPATDDFRAAIDAGGSTDDVFTWYDGLSLLYFPAALTIYVVGCLWLQEARSNTDPRHHERSAAWVWLGWWVPIVSLWFPYQVVRDVRDGSGEGARRLSIGLWWAAWLVMLVSSRISSSLSTAPDLVGALPTFEAVAAGATVVACALWCHIVLTITRAQRSMLARP